MTTLKLLANILLGIFVLATVLIWVPLFIVTDLWAAAVSLSTRCVTRR